MKSHPEPSTAWELMWWPAKRVEQARGSQPADTGGREPTVFQALTYFLQLLKTMRREIQIYDFLKS